MRRLAHSRGGRRAVALLVAGATLVAVAVPGLAGAERFQIGNLVLEADGGFRPSTLPKREFAPIELSMRGDISTVDGSKPIAVDDLIIDWDRNGQLTNRGLPVCRPGKLENRITADARKACRSSLVGVGYASGFVQFPDDEPFAASSTVLAFNGPTRGGKRTMLLHAYAFVPAPTTFVVPVTIQKIRAGRYGWRSTVDAPTIADGYGVVTHVDLKISRRWTFKRKRLSYLSARCADGRLQARGQVDFVDGSGISGSIFRPCKTRGGR
jgi:hypothetical protein